jgi:hypothetical protein
MQDLSIVLLLDIGEDALPRVDEPGTVPFGGTERRRDGADENSSGDACGEKQNVGNPIAHPGLGSIEHPCSGRWAVTRSAKTA